MYCFINAAQICGTPPTVKGATSQVIISDSGNNSFTVNTTITFTCPDNTTQTSTCSYLPMGGAQWIPDVQDCKDIIVVGKNT